jgi:hypothetical protein
VLGAIGIRSYSELYAPGLMAHISVTRRFKNDDIRSNERTLRVLLITTMVGGTNGKPDAVAAESQGPSDALMLEPLRAWPKILGILP